ncbi:hypothetical protein BSKO_00519 [Bryopsis sp. KO-2023]|nr:hypothetical protein BSKO_00519 [Bryopsis sp. KO-2023]
MASPASDRANILRQTAACWIVNLFVVVCRLWLTLLARIARLLVSISPSIFGRFLVLKRFAGSTGSVSSGSKTKEPKAVTIVLAETDASRIDIQKVARLVRWCIEEKMCYVFVYDPAGHVKANKGELLSQLSTSAPDWDFFVQAGWEKAGAQHGAAPPPFFPLPAKTAIVHALDEGNSLTPLVMAARNPQILSIPRHPGVDENGLPDVFSGLSPGQLKDLICELLGKSAVLEPDIVLVVGKVFTLAGCPPWHARFSEIYHLGVLESATRHEFDKAMTSYWKTYQRFGS